VSFSFSKQPTNIFYRWLKQDPNNHGQLIPSLLNVDIPAVGWNQRQNGNVVVEVPDPPNPACSFFGEAKWVKVTVTVTEYEVGAC
jgi:hypothetical protein